MVASQLPEVPVNSENRWVSDQPYGRGMSTSHKVVLPKGGPMLRIPSSAWEVVTGPSSSCPRALGSCEPGPLAREWSSDLQTLLEKTVWCGGVSGCVGVAGCRCGACVPRAPGVLVNRPKIRSFEGTECPRIFFSGVSGPEVPRAPRVLQNSTKIRSSEGTERSRIFFRVFLCLK